MTLFFTIPYLSCNFELEPHNCLANVFLFLYIYKSIVCTFISHNLKTYLNYELFHNYPFYFRIDSLYHKFDFFYIFFLYF